jgi:hypothetical protein
LKCRPDFPGQFGVAEVSLQLSHPSTRRPRDWRLP